MTEYKVYRNKNEQVEKIKGTEGRKVVEQETAKMVKRNEAKEGEKRSQHHCLFCRKMHRVLLRIIYFPSHFIAPHFHTQPPVFLSRVFHLLVPASLSSPPSHVSPCLRLRPFYSLFSKIIFIINLSHQNFINRQFYHGRPVS
jgi:hypothetical protein